MTREEIKEFSGVEPNCFETDREEDWYKIGCIDELDTADADPDTSSLWHNADEEPNDGTHILMEYSFLGSKEFKSYNISYNKLVNWNTLKKHFGISRWAYISDLLPKGGEL